MVSVAINFVEKFRDLRHRFDEIERALSDQSISQDPHKLLDYSRRHAELKEPVRDFLTYEKILAAIQEAQELLNDPEMRDMAREELTQLQVQRETLEEKLAFYLIPKDPDDSKNAFLEIRAGAGGEEAALFAGDLFRMYLKYAERNGFTVELESENATGMGGFKEIVAKINGREVFRKFKFEGGTHRVQRVPDTEASGRIHTSTCTVAIMPEVQEVDVKIDEKDIRVDVFRSSGAGGQHVNKTSSAVRMTHLPSGIVVQCQDERSQHKNRDKALGQLRAKLYDRQREERDQAHAQQRRSMVGTGDRAEKIRTYNFPENRVTDHRIKLTLHKLTDVLEGDLDELVQSLHAADQLKKLEAL